MLLKITNTEKALIVFLAAALIALVLQHCSVEKANKESENWKAKYDYQNQTIDSLKNKNGAQVAEQTAALTNAKEDIKKLSAEVFDLKTKDEKRIKEVEALVRLRQNVEIKEVKVPYIVHDTIPSIDSTNYNNWVHVPARFSDAKKDYQITGTVKKDSVEINSLSIPDTVSFRIAEKKQGLFKPKQTIVQAVHTNPFITTTGMNSLILKKPKTNTWNKVIKPLLGVAAGIFLSEKLLH